MARCGHAGPSLVHPWPAVMWADRATARLTSDGYGRARLVVVRTEDQVSLVPYDAVPAFRGGDPGPPALDVSVVGRGVTAEEERPGIVFIGGGPIQTAAIRHFDDVFGQEMQPIVSPAGQAWWAGSGLQRLDVQVRYRAARTGVRGRITGSRLGIFVDVSDASLTGHDRESCARELADQVVALVRRRTGLGPYPERAP